MSAGPEERRSALRKIVTGGFVFIAAALAGLVGAAAAPKGVTPRKWDYKRNRFISDDSWLLFGESLKHAS